MLTPKQWVTFGGFSWWFASGSSGVAFLSEGHAGVALPTSVDPGLTNPSLLIGGCPWV